MGDHCLVAGSAATIASIMSPPQALEWLNELCLPYLCVDSENRLHRNC
jgi:hypothetical protein